MLFVSTRGNTPKIPFVKTVLAGLAEDGGLYVPEGDIKVSHSFLKGLVGKSYADVAFAVLRLFASGIKDEELQLMLDHTYTPEGFCNVREGENPAEIVPVRKLWGQTYLAGLSNGPTLAFKDIAMRLLGRLMEYALGGQPLNIVGATSGDTGSAAIRAMLGRMGINVFMLSGGAMSDVQKAQMYSVLDPHIFNLRVQDFDTAQALVKDLAKDRQFMADYHIGAVNSINLARILAQVAYVFYIYLKVDGGRMDEVEFVVPSGNFGNACAVFLAKQMGLPIRQIIIATNENDVLHGFFTTGVYQRAKSVIQTTSPSMDIQVASNLERVVYWVLGQDANRVRALYEEFEATKRSDLSSELGLFYEAGFVSEVCKMDQCRLVMGQIFGRNGLLIDPHTATAVYAASHVPARGHSVRRIVLETALPSKFPEEVSHATGVTPALPKGLEGLLSLPQKVYDIEPSVSELQEFIRNNCKQ